MPPCQHEDLTCDHGSAIVAHAVSASSGVLRPRVLDTEVSPNWPIVHRWHIHMDC